MEKMYSPITKDEAQTKANKIAQKFCSKCSKDFACYQLKDGRWVHSCEECPWYLLMNAMIGELEF